MFISLWMDNTHFFAIIVAGGSGKRMNTEIPKQFLLLKGKPVIMHSIETFYRNPHQPAIIVVLNQNDIALWEQLVTEHDFNIPHTVVAGGAERFHSVKNGLDLIDDREAIVAVHDAVRPLVTEKTISNCYQTALKSGNAVAAVPSKDSVRLVKNGKSEALDRKAVYLVQTPQTFKLSQLKTAYQQTYNSFFTDDASVVEHAGFTINLEAGDDVNFKITFKTDLKLAESVLAGEL